MQARTVSIIIALGRLFTHAIAQDGQRGSKPPSKPSNSRVMDDTMGPAGIMWPPDRPWSADMDTQPPCGSRAPSANRTKYPLTGGAISLTGQDDYYKTRISISYSNDPKSNTDFSPLVDSADIHDLDPGHTCVKIPDAPPRVVAGANATLQITYKADWDAPHLQTFYACADITYVAAADFNFRIPCFNHTVPGEDNEAAAKSVGATSKQSAADNPEPSASAIVGHGQQMGGAAMAGAIVGSLGGASALVAMAILHRRKKQKERSLRLARMEENARREAYPGDKPAP